jgi:hypothetical protein
MGRCKTTPAGRIWKAAIVLEDLNRIIGTVQDLKALAQEAAPAAPKRDLTIERD